MQPARRPHRQRDHKRAHKLESCRGDVAALRNTSRRPSSAAISVCDRQRPEWIVRKVCVDFGSSCLFVPEHLAHHEEGISICRSKESEGMAKAKEWRRSCSRNPGSPARRRALPNPSASRCNGRRPGLIFRLDLDILGANHRLRDQKSSAREGPDRDVLSAHAFGAAFTKQQGSKGSSALNDDILTIAMPGFSSRCC
jgi:hypothetical protein